MAEVLGWERRVPAEAARLVGVKQRCSPSAQATAIVGTLARLRPVGQRLRQNGLINDKAGGARALRVAPKIWDLLRMTVASIALSEASQSAASGIVRVLFFGRIADVCGQSREVAIPAEGCSLTDLKARLADAPEGVAEVLREPCIRVAIDQVMVSNAPWVTPGQEVAFLSAFSGG